MTSRERLTALLNQHEGLRLKVYDDGTGKPIGPGSTVIGNPTIGYGLCLNTRGITPRQAAMLRDDALDEVDHQLTTRLACYARQVDARKMALLELGYQNGVEGLIGPNGFVKMLAHIDMREYAYARTELLASKWATQTGAARVEALATMIGDGTWPGSDPA